MFKLFSYLCFVVGIRQQLIINKKSLAALTSRFVRRGFFIPGSFQILPVAKTDYCLNRISPLHQYMNQASVGHDHPVSTDDLQEKKVFLVANAFEGYAGKVWWGVNKG